MKVLNRNLVLYKPSIEDASAIYELVRLSPPLEANSLYSYLLLCSHFSDTCVVVKDDQSNIVGFTSAYLLPKDSSRLFIWQIAIHPDFRRFGLAVKMINHLISNGSCNNVQFIDATVIPSNEASNGFFEKLASSLKTELNKEVIFPKEVFGAEEHEEEVLLSVGPLK